MYEYFLGCVILKGVLVVLENGCVVVFIILYYIVEEIRLELVFSLVVY